MSRYNLCLLGFGNVGRALARLLLEKTEELRGRYGVEWRLTGVATRRLGWLAAPDGLDVSALLDGDYRGAVRAEGVHNWLRAARADVLFEISSLEPLTGQPAIDHIRAALEFGAHAVTANKGPVVHAYRELDALARSRGLRFLFEASFMGGAPIYSLFRETLPAATLLRFAGILNSTTTVILDAMEAGRSFDEAVAIAQAMGITETDPSADVDGWDAAVKVCALANVLIDVPLRLDQVERRGIRDLAVADLRAARAAGERYLLVSRLGRVDGRLVAMVRPERLPAGDPLASVRGADLMAQFELDTLPGLTITAHDGSPATTAYDMLADFITITRGDAARSLA